MKSTLNVTTFFSFVLNCLLLAIELKTDLVPITEEFGELAERIHAKLININQRLDLLEDFDTLHMFARQRYESRPALELNLTVSDLN